MSGCASKPATFGDDVAFLRQHTSKLIVLEDGPMRVAVAPELQGRVMTASFAGDEGRSLGWVNRAAVEKGTTDPVFNNFGGADRFWLGPEGGQFSLFFAPGDPQDIDHWVVPRAFDAEPFTVVSSNKAQVQMTHRMELVNYSNRKLRIAVERLVKLIGRDEAARLLKGPIPDELNYVGYASLNSIRNVGSEPWTRQTGGVSIWILGMYVPSKQTVVIAPYNKQGQGPIVTDYGAKGTAFNKIPPDRLKILERQGVVLFRTDGQYRSKIGLSPARATDRIGSIDLANGILTVVVFDKPAGETAYVNSIWTPVQKDPFAGDVSNSYNDGPVKPGGKPLGGFYELETSSPAALLGPNQSKIHVHRTMHMQGPIEKLSPIAERVLGVRLADVREAMFGE